MNKVKVPIELRRHVGRLCPKWINLIYVDFLEAQGFTRYSSRDTIFISRVKLGDNGKVVPMTKSHQAIILVHELTHLHQYGEMNEIKDDAGWESRYKEMFFGDYRDRPAEIEAFNKQRSMSYRQYQLALKIVNARQ